MSKMVAIGVGDNHEAVLWHHSVLIGNLRWILMDVEDLQQYADALNEHDIEKTLSAEDYRQLGEGAEIVATDPFGDKVLRLTDGNYLKLFRVKRAFSSARFWPYSRRFADNAKRLAALDVPVPQVLETCRIPSIQRTAGRYWEKRYANWGLPLMPRWFGILVLFMGSCMIRAFITDHCTWVMSW
jgi:hypothetical protein